MPGPGQLPAQPTVRGMSQRLAPTGCRDRPPQESSAQWCGKRRPLSGTLPCGPPTAWPVRPATRPVDRIDIGRPLGRTHAIWFARQPRRRNRIYWPRPTVPWLDRRRLSRRTSACLPVGTDPVPPTRVLLLYQMIPPVPLPAELGGPA